MGSVGTNLENQAKNQTNGRPNNCDFFTDVVKIGTFPHKDGGSANDVLAAVGQH